MFDTIRSTKASQGNRGGRAGGTTMRRFYCKKTPDFVFMYLEQGRYVEREKQHSPAQVDSARGVIEIAADKRRSSMPQLEVPLPYQSVVVLC